MQTPQANLRISKSKSGISDDVAGMEGVPDMPKLVGITQHGPVFWHKHR